MQLTDLYDKPGHLIRRAQQIAVAIFSEECGALDITPAQYEILLAIRSQPGTDATRLSELVALPFAACCKQAASRPSLIASVYWSCAAGARM